MGKPISPRTRAEIAVSQFAGLLHSIRKEAGLSQVELARTVGVATARISEYENGVRNPSWETVLALAFALGVSTDDFYRKRKP